MAAALRTALDQRVTALRDRWVERITAALDEGRVADAVRASIRPPEPAARLASALAVRLAEAASAAMSTETPPDQWLALLEVVVDSPVRRTVKPAGLPEGADENLLAAARKASGYVPELARLMGIPIPPPPGPRRPVPARSSPSRRAPPDRPAAVGQHARRGRAQPIWSVHGEHAGLEPGRLVEVLGPPVTGEGDPVHPLGALLLEPGDRRVQQQPTHPHPSRPRLDETGVEYPAGGAGYRPDGRRRTR